MRLFKYSVSIEMWNLIVWRIMKRCAKERGASNSSIQSNEKKI